MRISHLDGERLRRALVSACEYVQQRRAELNRINVFPVPDGDTGTNLALTAGAIAERLRPLREASVGVVARETAEAAILGARGNCGMILSHFLLGFSRDVGTRLQLSAQEFAAALSAAVRHVYRSLERPVEGTIVTVMREVAEEAEARRTEDFADLVESLLTRANAALARTPDLLPQLRAAGVVDAGAKGFVHMMEGVVAYVRGDPFVALEVLPSFAELPAAAALAEYPTASERYRYCTEALVRGAAIPDADSVRAVLREGGDSLIVIRGDGVLKVHVHTDDPDGVFTYLRGLGELVTHKAEDMAAQHAAVERAAAAHVQLARRPLSIVTDSACNLSSEIVRAHGIHVVPMFIVFGDEIVRDGVDLDADAFTRRLRAGEQPTTSQPPPAAFLEAYRRAAEDGETVLAITVGSALSGTFRSAEAAAKQVPEVPLVLFDSRGASLTQGLLVLRAAELAELGTPVARITAELDRIRRQSGIFFTVDVFDNLLASGRVGRGKVMIAGLLDIKPILGIDEEGRVGPLANVRGSANVLPRMLQLLAARIPSGARVLRFGVVHVGCRDVAERVAGELRGRFGEREILIAPASPVLATHLGPGAWGIAWQVED
jgi:DegV family protein with EDD domain